MKTLATVAATLVGVAVAGGIAYAGYSFTQAPEYAQVVAIKPVIKHWTTPKQVCHQVAVQTRQPTTADGNQLIGTALGAIAGGVLGHQVGGGHGQDVATVVGAMAGAYAGRRTEQHLKSNNTQTTYQQRCTSVDQPHSKQDGYKVTYEYQGTRQSVHMAHKPGARLAVENGKVVVD